MIKNDSDTVVCFKGHYNGVIELFTSLGLSLYNHDQIQSQKPVYEFN